jgi:hypothetical protein
MFAVFLIPGFNADNLNFIRSGEVFDLSGGEREFAAFKQCCTEHLATFGDCHYVLRTCRDGGENTEPTDELNHLLESYQVPHPTSSSSRQKSSLPKRPTD